MPHAKQGIQKLRAYNRINPYQHKTSLKIIEKAAKQEFRGANGIALRPPAKSLFFLRV